MKYYGKELEPVTEPQVFNPPRWMIVSNFSDGEGTEALVLAIVRYTKGYTYAISEMPNGDIMKWAYCAEPPKEEPKLATYRQLAKWLAEGKGEMKAGSELAYTHMNYNLSRADSAADSSAKVRKWDDTEWHEPTREYLGLEGE